MKKVEVEKPFKILLSRELQAFLKEQKLILLDYIEKVKTHELEDLTEDDKKIYYSAVALFKLSVPELNLFIIKTYGQYNSTTELAELMGITKLTVCSHIRKTKIYIKDYVTSHI